MHMRTKETHNDVIMRGMDEENIKTFNDVCSSCRTANVVILRCYFAEHGI